MAVSLSSRTLRIKFFFLFAFVALLYSAACMIIQFAALPQILSREMWVFVTLAVLFAFTACIVFVVSANILGPLSKTAHAVRSSDFKSIVPSAVGGDLGDMVGAFNGFIGDCRYLLGESTRISAHLSAYLGSVSKVALNFSDSTYRQAATAEQISAAIDEISAGVDNIQVDFQHLTDFTARITELSDIISAIDSQVGDTAQLTRDISVKANTGADSMSRMSSSMNLINDSSHKMTDIVGIINDISDQINLLSLNASIEAARAGDSGRGFAVVADEISKLAERTASSIKEIDSLIAANKNEIKNAMSGVGMTVTMIETVIAGVDSINTKMGSISDNVKKQASINVLLNSDSALVEKKIHEIEVATREQKASIEEITESMMSIGESTQTCSRHAEEIANSIVEASSMAEVLKLKVSQV